MSNKDDENDDKLINKEAKEKIIKSENILLNSAQNIKTKNDYFSNEIRSSFDINTKNNKKLFNVPLSQYQKNLLLDSDNKIVEIKGKENNQNKKLLNQVENNEKVIQSSIIDSMVHSTEEINILIEENNKLKLELNDNNYNNLKIKYRELLLDYQKIQAQNNKLIEQNEFLKNENDEIQKESSKYKNKYNLIIKEQKKTKNLLEDISNKYNSNISFQEQLEKQK